MSDSDVGGVVIENGSDTCKIGLTSEQQPRLVINTVVGKHNTEGLPSFMITEAHSEYFIGRHAQERRDILDLVYPISRGVVHNWDDMEKIWDYAFRYQLKISPDDYFMLLTAPFVPKRNRKKMVEVMFEKFKIPAIYLGYKPALSLYATGNIHGCVVNCGHDFTSIVPIENGYPIIKSIRDIDVAGKQITKYLKNMLRHRHQLPIFEENIYRQLKEKWCYVAANFPVEVSNVDLHRNTIEKRYRLPDGHYVDIAEERFKCTEILFQPTMIGLDIGGIHSVLYHTVMGCQQYRRMFNYTLITGGSAVLPGFNNRLDSELKSYNIGSTITVNLPTKKYLSWFGGSILGSVSTFPNMCAFRDHYTEQGSRVVRIFDPPK